MIEEHTRLHKFEERIFTGSLMDQG